MFDFEKLQQEKLKILAGVTAVLFLFVGFLFVRDLVVFGQNNGLATPLDSGDGEYDPEQIDLLSDTQRQEIGAMLDRNTAILAANGRLPAPDLATDVLFAWPLKLKGGLSDPGYHGISGFVDHNPAYPDQLRDYNCSNRTYDTSSGYNHKGTDFFLWPFGWNKMDADEVEIVAAAPGTIVGKQDGNADRSCSFNGNPWNAVYVMHTDGSIAWYGHMKNGSLTTKAIGETVEAGDYLGVVGSSGNSTGPHLHFEIYRTAVYLPSNLIDPYAGSCNSLNGSTSWWAAQRPYYDSAVNKLTTGFARVEFTDCPNPTISNKQNRFSPGNIVYFTAYYRDQLNSQDSVNRIYRPDNSIFATWTVNSNADDGHYAASYWWRSYELPVDASEGIWIYEVVFAGGTYRHEFVVEMQSNFLPLIRKDPAPTPTPTAAPTSTVTKTPTATISATVTMAATILPIITP